MTSKQTFLSIFIFFIVFLSFSTYDKLLAQKTFNGDKELKTQGDVNYFGSIGYNTIAGDLKIGNFNTDITDLSPLSTITVIDGSLEIYLTKGLINLNGLNNLTSVGKSIWIWENDGLTNLKGLNNLTSIGGYLWIEENKDLTNLNGLNNLTSIGGSLRIDENKALTNLNELNNLTSVGGYLGITRNDLLIDLNGLNNLTTIGGGLSVGSFVIDYPDIKSYGNFLLKSLNGLNNLTSVGGSIKIAGNASLTDLNALKQITLVEKDLIIYKNYSLKNLDGLNNITSIGRDLKIGIYSVDRRINVHNENASLENINGLSKITNVENNLIIIGNDKLPNLDGLKNIISVGGDLMIKRNGALTSYCGLYPLLSTNGLTYSYIVEHNAVNPTRQEIIDFGPCSTTAITDISLPVKFKLSQNYPNPFNPTTVIRYSIPKQSIVTLKVFNILGKEVKTLVNEVKPIGNYKIEFNASSLPSGVYFYRLQSSYFSETKKLILLR